jgi:hypothetical protein
MAYSKEGVDDCRNGCCTAIRVSSAKLGEEESIPTLSKLFEDWSKKEPKQGKFE